MNLAQLKQYKNEIIQLAQKYNSTNVRIFGSVARGENTPDSDIDFLIDMTPEQDLFDFIRLTRELSQLLGCKVDIVHSNSLHHSIRQQILDEAISL